MVNPRALSDGQIDPFTTASKREIDSSASLPETLSAKDKASEDDSLASSPTAASNQGNGNCAYMDNCQLESPDRRVISHFFGRNKRETRAIPGECWVTYCRQHYQRCRYRMYARDFATLQMGLVLQTVQKLEAWGGVQDWQIAIRKRQVEAIRDEDAEMGTRGGSIPNGCRERVLLPFLGDHKNFQDVYAVIRAVDQYAQANDCEALEFEVVPRYRPEVEQARAQAAKSAKTPTKKRGSSASGMPLPGMAML